MFRFLDILRAQAFAPGQPKAQPAAQPQPAAPPLPPWMAWMNGGDRPAAAPAAGSDPAPAAAKEPAATDFADPWIEDVLAANSAEASPVVGAREAWGDSLGELVGEAELDGGPVLTHTAGKGLHVGEVPDAEGKLTERVTLDPASGKMSIQKVEDEGRLTRSLDFGKSSVGGSLSMKDKDDQGVERSGKIKGSYDWDKGKLSLGGGGGRKAGRADDYSAEGSLAVSSEGVALSAGYTTGTGAGRRGGNVTIDTAEGTYGAGIVHGDLALGATKYKDGFAAQASYGGVGGGAMFRHGDGRTAIGANVALSKELSVNAMVSFGDDEWYVGGGATYLGFGGGLGYGETNAKMSKDDDGERVSSTREDGTVVNGNISAVVASGEGSETTRRKSTASAARPADFDSWSTERQQAWRKAVDDEAHDVDHASELDLDKMAEGASHRFDDSDTLSGKAAIDVAMPGTGFHGHLAGSKTDASSLAVTHSGADRFDVNEGTMEATSSDMGASGEMLFGAISASGNRKKEHAEARELGYRLEGGAAKEAFEKNRLQGGLLPGADRHPGYAEAMRLAGKQGRSVVEETRLAALREELNGEVRKEARVGETLADGTLVTRTALATHEGSDTAASGRFLFWGGSSKVRTTSDSQIVDELDDDGSLDHTEVEGRSRAVGDHAEESIQALTTTDEDGPAVSFKAHQILRGADHVMTAQSAGAADVLPGESSFKGERTLDTGVSLSRAEAREVATVLNAPGSDHWAKMAARIEAFRQDSPLVAGFICPPKGVDSPEDFKKLPPFMQEQWLKAAQLASTGEKGNVFDSVPAIELIADPERKREAYEELVLLNQDRKGIKDDDLGAEYLEFAASMKDKSQGQLDLADDAQTSTAGESYVKGKITSDKAQYVMNPMMQALDPGCVTKTLTAVKNGGGPAEVAAAARKAQLDPVRVYERVGGDPREMQALLEATAGTEFGERLQHVMAAGGRMGGGGDIDDGFARFFLQAAAGAPVTVDAQEGAPPRSNDERRGRSLARNLDIPGTGSVVAATLIEAVHEGGPAAVAAALRDAGGISVKEVIEKLQENGDGGAAMQLIFASAGMGGLK